MEHFMLKKNLIANRGHQPHAGDVTPMEKAHV
jgi:hypothetical protein